MPSGLALLDRALVSRYFDHDQCNDDTDKTRLLGRQVAVGLPGRDTKRKLVQLLAEYGDDLRQVCWSHALGLPRHRASALINGGVSL